MAKFIEVQKLSFAKGASFPVLQNLDYIASVTAGYIPGTSVIELQRVPDLAGASSYMIREPYDEIRERIATIQGGISTRGEVI